MWQNNATFNLQLKGVASFPNSDSFLGMNQASTDRKTLSIRAKKVKANERSLAEDLFGGSLAETLFCTPVAEYATL